MSRVLLPEERFIGKILDLFQEIKKKGYLKFIYKKKQQKKSQTNIYLTLSII